MNNNQKGQRHMTGKTGKHLSCGQRTTEDLYVNVNSRKGYKFVR